MDDDLFAVRFSSIELLTNREHAQQSIWWHLSKSADLFVNDRDELMHWGEFDTAMHHYVTRLKGRDRFPDGDMYLYSAMLLPSKNVASTVVVENQGLAEHGEIAQNYAKNGPTRYLNARECPGSISLLARKGDFEVHQAYDLTQTDDSIIQLPPTTPDYSI